MNTVLQIHNFIGECCLPELDEQIVALITSFIMFICVLILCWFIFSLVKNLLETVIDFLQYKFIISTNIDYDSITKALDSIISTSISDYIMLNGLYEQFIGENQEKELREYVSKALNDQLSSAFMQKLEFIYNKDAIPDLLARRILTTISIYIAKNNAAIKK